MYRLVIGFLLISTLGVSAGASSLFETARVPRIDSSAIYKVALQGQKIWAGSTSHLFYSSDAGLSWKRYDTLNGFGRGAVSCLMVTDSSIWSATYFDTTDFTGRHFYMHSGFFKSDTAMSGWVNMGHPGGIYPGNITYDMVLTPSGDIWTANWWGSLRRSTNGGSSWTLYAPPPPLFIPSENATQRIFCTAVRDSIVWAGSEEGLHLSIDSGATWTTFTHISGHNSITGNRIITMAWRSELSPELWVASWTDFDTSQVSGVSVTSNHGQSWQTYLAGYGIWRFLFYNQDIFIASDSGLIMSSDNGGKFVNLTQGFLPESTTVFDVAITTDSIIWIGTSLGLYRGNYAGTTWEKIDPLALDARSEAPPRPVTFELGQNYPNPFNPQTTIPVALARAGGIRIEIYDILGRRQKQVASGNYPPGQYRFSWDGTDDRGHNLASGVYFYKLTVGDKNSSRAMILLR